MKRSLAVFMCQLIALLAIGLPHWLWAADNGLSLGVLAFRPKPETLVRWQPTVDYLAAKIGCPVKLVALNYPELEAAIARRQLDFVLTNPGHYVLLTQRNGLSSPLATLIGEENGQELSQFGGVIVTRAERADIATLADLHGKTVAATDAGSLGGYEAQAYELIQAGFSMPGEVNLQITGMPHDRALAATDSLTKLANRRYFHGQLKQEWARLQRSGGPAALLMLDLDHFKQVNDSYSHAAGDAVLRRFAELVSASLRKTDQAGRLGGEEFAILLPGADHAGALEFAERLRARVAADEIAYDDRELRITVSIGVAELAKSDATAEVALARADAALYRAKANGRNRVETG